MYILTRLISPFLIPFFHFSRGIDCLCFVGWFKTKYGGQKYGTISFARAQIARESFKLSLLCFFVAKISFCLVYFFYKYKSYLNVSRLVFEQTGFSFELLCRFHECRDCFISVNVNMNSLEVPTCVSVCVFATVFLTLLTLSRRAFSSI